MTRFSHSLARFAAFSIILLSASAFADSAPGAVQVGNLVVESGWVRATPNGAKAGAAYLTVENKGNVEDRLISGSSDVAPTVQVHEMKVDNGVMSMREVEGGLALPAHSRTDLKPGSYHLMLIGLTKPIAPGQDVALTLHFAKAGDVTLHLPAKDAYAMKSSGGMGGMMQGGGAK
jgi:periplasmic copper chaperone A